MKKRFVSVDVETSGSTPGKYAMLSLGACIVGHTEIQFYRELKPISKEYIPKAMKVGCKGLRCLEPFKNIPIYDLESNAFQPAKVLELLTEEGEEPGKAMSDFSSWIQEHCKGYKAVEAAQPIKFDGMFTAWYFDNFFLGQNPLGHSGIDIQSFYRGSANSFDADLSRLMPILPHNALEDAIVQAKAFEEILKACKCEY